MLIAETKLIETLLEVSTIAISEVPSKLEHVYRGLVSDHLRQSLRGSGGSDQNQSPLYLIRFPDILLFDEDTCRSRVGEQYSIEGGVDSAS